MCWCFLWWLSSYNYCITLMNICQYFEIRNLQNISLNAAQRLRPEVSSCLDVKKCTDGGFETHLLSLSEMLYLFDNRIFGLKESIGSYHLALKFMAIVCLLICHLVSHVEG